MRRAAGPLAVLAAGVILSAHASALECGHGRTARTEWLHAAAGLLVLAGVAGLAWLGLGRAFGDGGPGRRLADDGADAEVIEFPRLGAEARRRAA